MRQIRLEEAILSRKVDSVNLVDLSVLRINNNPDIGKIMWISQTKTVSIMRLRDNKKKAFTGFWNINENRPDETVKPIGLEFENKSGKIFGLVQDSYRKYYFIMMYFKEKEKEKEKEKDKKKKSKKTVVPTSNICLHGRSVLRSH
jgi:hypothetical protein